MSKPLAIIILLVCVLLSALFSGSEIAYAKVNKIRLKRAAEKKEKGAKLAYFIAEHYSETITTILIGNNLVNILASSVATVLFVAVLGPDKGELFATLLMTLIILIFGEILPKSISSSYAYKATILYAWPIRIFYLLFKPFVFLGTKLVNAITNALTIKEKVSDDELLTMVDTLEEQGIIDEGQQELISNAIDFMDVDAIEIMQHRTDVFAFDINDDIRELLSNPHLLDYSRIPVYDENIDNIIGILNSKQLLKLHLNGNDIHLKEILTEPLYVFQTQAISDILRILKKEHIHMAIVKDEYGGTAGILTMEDILEELVGDILDEKDIVEMDEYHKVNKNKFTVDGAMNIYDFFDIIHYNAENFESMYTTVGGWITGVLEKFPEEGDSFEFENYRITVMRADEFTVDRVSVEKINEEE